MADRDESLDALRQRGEAFLEAISEEYHAAYAGLKGEPKLQPIYAAHEAAYNDEAFAQALELFKATQPTDGGSGAGAGTRPGAATTAGAFAESASAAAHRSSRILLDWLIESRIGRELAALDEREIAWENKAVVRTPDGAEQPYQKVPITLGNTRDAATRRALDNARSTLVERELAPMRLEKFQREHELVASFGIATGYNASWEALSGVSLDALRAECEAFLRDTQAMWDEIFPEFLKRGLDLTPTDATRADVAALMRAPQFDPYFTAEEMERQVRRQVTEMGTSPDANGRVRYDTAEREGKRPRAFCAPVRIPDVVHLVLRPHGGQNDWMTLLHELGHALHFANMDRALPFEFRWLGDNSVTEGYAMLFDHRLKDRGWLARYSGLGKTELGEFLRYMGFEELHFVRRYCAKLIYETQLHSGTVAWSALPDLFVQTLSDATGFRYQRSDAFVDVDPRYYAARYLRAWQLQAVLDESLRERFDADWWRNPRAGPWMVEELFAHGQRELAHEQAQRVAGKGLSFAPVIAGIERMVG
ncbi:MAG: hypothetical protein KF709_10940 [Gemmatimonadaceae bacterium]|nr:hypothetical protein [Gemmatimonadaceae bacterium]